MTNKNQLGVVVSTLAARVPEFTLLLLALAASPGVRGDVPDECAAPANLAQTLQLETRCLSRPEFLYRLGRQLNTEKRYAEALDRLEAALLLRPEDWPTELEYSIALEGVGDRASADALLEQLSKNPAVDLEIRQEIAKIQRQHRVRHRAESVSVATPSRRTVLGLAGGHDNNLLGSTRYGNFDLTLADSRLPVTVAPEYAARSGHFARLDIGQDGEIHVDAQARWQYSLAASYRWSIDYAPANRAHLGGLVERSPQGNAGYYTQALYQELHLGGPPVLRQWQLGGGYEFTPQGASSALPVCRTRLGLEVQGLTYPGSGTFNGRYGGVLAHWVCPAPQIQLQLRFGQDTPDNAQRPGGAQRQQSLRLAKNTALGPGKLALEYEYYRQDDQKGYSLLLENNGRRQLRRSIYRLEYSWQQQGLTPYLGLEWLDQESNLPLFSPRNRILTLGLRRAW